MKKIFGLVISIAVAQTAGVIGSFFTTRSISTWYAFLSKPSFTPPSWVFAPAWITLYTLMGIAAYIVWSSGGGDRARKALGFYGINLVLNASWSVVFFGLQSPGVGLLVITVLLLVILALTIKFWHIRRLAGILLVPYLAWVSFALILNLYIWRLN